MTRPAPRARRVPASSAAWYSSAPPASRWNANRLGGAGLPSTSGSSLTIASIITSAADFAPGQHVVADGDFLDPHPAGRRRRPPADRCPRSARRRTPGASRRSSRWRVGLGEQPARRRRHDQRGFVRTDFVERLDPTLGAFITMPGPPPYGESSTAAVHVGRSSAAGRAPPNCTIPASIALPGQRLAQWVQVVGEDRDHV